MVSKNIEEAARSKSSPRQRAPRRGCETVRPLLLLVLIAQIACPLIVTIPATVKHETHQSASDNYREHDAKDHCQPAMKAYRCASCLFPSPNCPTNRCA